MDRLTPPEPMTRRHRKPQTVIHRKFIVGMHEIAERAGVQRGTVLMWRQRYNHFPDPLLELNIGPIWNWLDVEAWLHRYPAGKRTA